MNKNWYSKWGYFILFFACMKLFGILQSILGACAYAYFKEKKGEFVASVAMILVSSVAMVIVYSFFDMSY